MSTERGATFAAPVVVDPAQGRDQSQPPAEAQATEKRVGERYANDFVCTGPGTQGDAFLQASPYVTFSLASDLQDCFGGAKPNSSPL